MTPKLRSTEPDFRPFVMRILLLGEVWMRGTITALPVSFKIARAKRALLTCAAHQPPECDIHLLNPDLLRRAPCGHDSMMRY